MESKSLQHCYHCRQPIFSIILDDLTFFSWFSQKKKMFRTIWQMWSKTRAASGDQFGDVHTRLMKKNYKVVPQWWFHLTLVLVVALSIYACEGFNNQLQLTWWGVLLCCAIALFFTLPIGIITATTNQAWFFYMRFDIYITPSKRPFLNQRC